MTLDRFAVVIGAMKAGTTLLHRWLASHPEIAPGLTKELNYLSNRGCAEAGIEAYAARFQERSGAHVGLDASTAYTKLPVQFSAALSARSLKADFRFLYLVRNPVARIRSHYLHSLAEGWMPQPIHAGIEPVAVLFSNYRFQIEPYLVSHDPARLLVASYEEFVAAQREFIGIVCGFLGIDPAVELPEPGKQNSSDTHHARAALRVGAILGLLPESILPEVQKVPQQTELAPWLVERLGADQGTVLAERLELELRRACEPDPAQVHELHQRLDHDLARFAERFGVDPWTGERHFWPELSAAA